VSARNHNMLICIWCDTDLEQQVNFCSRRTKCQL
jgi:hypothetical protein